MRAALQRSMPLNGRTLRKLACGFVLAMLHVVRA
jgi:hypothetical protein